MTPDDITIRPIADTDSLEELTDLLHRAYKVLADMGLKYVATYQDVKVTRRRIARGTCLIAVQDNRIVGTITYYSPESTFGSDYLNRPDVAHFGQMAVDPDLQGNGLGARLIEQAEQLAAHPGVAELALDTAETATHLIDWYTRLGYRTVGHVQWNMTNYRSVVMSKTIVPDAD